jgi:hypothetical protein
VEKFRNSVVRATKSVSQLISASTTKSFASFIWIAMMPSLVAFWSFLSAYAKPLFRRYADAYSRSSEHDCNAY